jgi:hypothetical protein
MSIGNTAYWNIYYCYNMKIAIMQPTFLPWLGYFALMDYVDLFIYLDDVQVSPKSYCTRNRVPEGKDLYTWLTIKESKDLPLSQRILKDTTIINAEHSYREISKTLCRKYNHESLEKFNLFLQKTLIESQSIAQINISLIEFICAEIGISPQVLRASSLNSHGKKSEKVLSILNNFDWSTYIVVPGAVDYMKLDEIWFGYQERLKVFNYKPVSYNQKDVEEFVPYMSAVDALLELGGKECLFKLREGVLELRDWA